MRHRNSKRPLAFERLEAMELLSGIGVAAHQATAGHAAEVHQAPVVDLALNLSGTLGGTYRLIRGGAEASFSGKGGVTAIGKAQLKGTLARGSASGGGQFTLAFGRRGKITAAITGVTATGAYTYQVTNGTRTFVGDSGTGLALVDILSANRSETQGRFSLTFEGASTS